MSDHKKFMSRCIELAYGGLGQVAPNPMVGCVIVNEGEIIGEGFHHKYGEAHAEVNAIASVSDKSLLKTSTLYVNLEPCSHTGKTPPCSTLIIQHKIPFIITGNSDPNPLVNGRGITALKNAGFVIQEHILEQECRELNKRFFCFHENKRPYIILKWAQSADGFIDADRSKKEDKPARISNAESRKLLHKWRSEEMAIMVGTNTALLDNPMLTVREWEGKNPVRVVPDKWLRIPKHNHLLDGSTPTIVFTATQKVPERNIEYVQIDFEKNIASQMLAELYDRQIQSVIIEGGEQLLRTFISEDLFDEARVFTSKKKLEKGVKAPLLDIEPVSRENISGDELLIYNKP